MKLKSLHTTATLEFYTPDFSTDAPLPYVDAGLRAGFPSPADDFIELSIDINKEYIKNRDCTFFAKVKGHSMKNTGIYDGDLLIIDKSLEPQNDKIAVCQIDSTQTNLNILEIMPLNRTNQTTPQKSPDTNQDFFYLVNFQL